MLSSAAAVRREAPRTSEWAAVYLGVAAATLPAVLPVMVGVLADALGFGVVRAGYVASANLGGVAVGSLVCAAAARRWSWPVLIRAGAAVLIGANVLTMTVSSFSVMAPLRFAAGVGEGVVAAICYASMSGGSQPARALAFYIAGQGLVGAVGMGVIPGIVARAGWPWLFLLVSAVALPAFRLAALLDTRQPDDPVNLRMAGRQGSRRPVVALAGLLIYFIGMSAVWALTERIGHAAHIDAGHLAMALSSSAVANMGGSLLVGVLAHRLGTAPGLLAGFSATTVGLVLLAIPGHWLIFTAGVCCFFFSWGFHFPFLFRLLAQLDAGGRLAALIPLMTGGGFAAGPALGGLLLAAGGTRSVCVCGAVCVTLSTFGAMTLNLHLNNQERLP